MKKNWYVIYSKPQLEKKIVAACNKKKVENYFPLKRVNRDSSKKGRDIYEPLFISMIFINATDEEVNDVRKMDGVLSIMYWQDRPAVINPDEVAAIKEFTSLYENLRVEQSVVNLQQKVTNVSTAVKSAEGNVYSINCKIIKMNLPSLGFTLVAEVDSDPVFGRSEFNLKSDLAARKQQD
jgi:transcription antitermination factor NusG